MDWQPWGPEVFEEARRADVDAVYMAACVAMNGSGGWPLTVLLTPDQKPFWAGTYLSKGQLLYLLHAAVCTADRTRTATGPRGNIIC